MTSVGPSVIMRTALMTILAEDGGWYLAPPHALRFALHRERRTNTYYYYCDKP
jgi:hypothetical protein